MALRVAGRVRFELNLIELEPGQTLERDGYSIAAVPTRHRGPAYGYVAVRRPTTGRVRSQAARSASDSRPAPISVVCSAARVSAE